MSNHEARPWGEFFVLSEAAHYKCKRMCIEPGHQISYQSHKHREEHWVFIRGQGIITLNDIEHHVQAGSYFKVPQQARHRIKNTGTTLLEFIEVQLGSYFGEDDIVRHHDDYGR